jgi:lysophospholipase L1-like esterase
MKRALLALLLAVSAMAQTTQLPVPRQFRKGDVWAAVGDSITHSRRYHSFIYLYYLTHFPGARFEMVNCGVSGDTASGAVRRFAWDIEPHKPTIATVMMGMNDVGRGNYGKDKTDPALVARRQASIDGHMANMDKLSALLQGIDCDIIYLTPSIYDQTAEITCYNNFGVNDALGVCGQRVAAELAPKYHAGVADLHDPMTALNAAYQKDDPTKTLVGADRVHPGDMGQFIMAYLFLKAQCVPALVADMAVDTTGKVQASTNCTLTDVQGKTDEVSFTYLGKSLPYPIPPVAKGALDLIPFVKDMDQEILRVAGLPDGTYVVVIDDEPVLATTAKELTGGINLATCQRTPMYRQAMDVAALNDQRHAIPAHRLRTLAAQRHFMGRNKDLDTGNYEAMKAALEARVAELKEKKHPLYGYMKGQAAIYIKYKPQEKELLAELAKITDELWQINQPKPHRIAVRRGSEEEIAKATNRLLEDFTTFRGWGEAGWTNCKAQAEVKGGILTVVAPRKAGERDMLGYSKNLSADLSEAKALKIRYRADKGAPFGVEWNIDGKLTRLRSYVPATGDWETISIPLAGKGASGFTLILAEGGAKADWDKDTVTYQFDKIWLE